MLKNSVFPAVLSKPVLCLTTLACLAGPAMTAHAACNFMGSGKLVAANPPALVQSDHAMAANSTTSLNRSSGASIVGLWTATFTSGGQVFDVGYDQWHSDGTEILNDIAPPQPANGAGTICLGVYVKTGPNTYHLRHPFWSMDSNGNLAATGFILEDITLDQGANTYSGSFTFLEYDLNNTLIFSAEGVVEATRMTAD